MPLFSRQLHPVRHVPSAPDPGLTASALLERYRPLRTRAAGGFGTVEVCLDTRLQRRVAIKRMPLASRYASEPVETRETALAEARTASLLQHPNIISVIDFTYDAEFAYLVMEYVDGMSLEEFLRQVEGNSLTYDEAACIADALVQALAFAHQNGVLHLDIKPANVLIDRNGHVKLADFGMATLSMAAGFGGARGGTIGYMPPEQLGGDTVDERTDIFALAAVLYESLCATAPFRAGTPADSLKRIKRGAVAPSSLLPDIPELTEEAMLSAMSPDPDDRMGSVAEFGDMFLAHLGSPRAGRSSLSRMIEEITSDDGAATGAQDDEHTVWELDPAEGYLGSRDERARLRVTRALAGLSAAVSSGFMLSLLEVSDVWTMAVVAAAIGVAGAAAPQLCSALLATGLAIVVATSADYLTAAPVCVVLLALFAGWWVVWGRVRPAASAVLAMCLAVGFLARSPVLAAGCVVFFAAYSLAPVPGFATVLLGCLSTQLALSAPEMSLSAAGPVSALADWHLLAGSAAVAAAAAAVSFLLGRLWRDIQASRGKRLAIAVYVTTTSLVTLSLCLANPVEIGGAASYPFALALGTGALSSIMLFVCIYLLGYRKDPSEGDRA